MSFIDEVRADRQPLAHVLKKHLGIRKIVEELYPDRAHFIYELLQNAEDTKATEAVFVLEAGKLTFEHNGRPFTEADIWGITDIGEGTKSGDQDKIGRFGVGFKSVFAYSETPHIWSPTFNFKISELVLPSGIPEMPSLGQKTRFEFIFDNPKKSPEDACAEVKAGLEELAETTLLFLSNLQSIRWQIGTEPFGEVLRIPHSANHIEILTQVNGGATTSSHFLRFSAPVQGLEIQRLALAFELDFLPDVTVFASAKPLAKQLRVIPANPGHVAVFFPARSESSGLRFHLHAPFVPELSRASIKDTPANDPLYEQLAGLAAASLPTIRDLNLLSVDFLGVLPTPQDSIPPRYQPIRAAIVEAMNNHPLTPTHAKSHAPAKQLLQAKAILKDFLSSEDIEFLVDYEDEPPQWAIAAPQKNSNADRFLSALAITEWDVDSFTAVLSLKASHEPRFLLMPQWTNIRGPDAAFMTWLEAKSPEWHQQMYALLYADIRAKPERLRVPAITELKQLQIVRLGTCKHTIGNKCFFPSDGVEQDAILPRVDPKIYSSGKSKTQQEEARQFLEDIGVREVGEAEQTQAILDQKYKADSFHPDLKDLERFVALWEKDNKQATIFANYFIFKRTDGKWGRPGDVYLDSPHQTTGLNAYFNMLGDNPNKLPLSAEYHQVAGLVANWVKFAEAVGVQARLEVEQVSCRDNPAAQELVRQSPGGWSYTYGVDRDYTIQGIAALLTKHDEALSRLVWTTACDLKETRWLSAQYRNNSHYNYRESASQLVCILRDTSWIPQTDGRFVRPCEASMTLLPKGFPYDDGYEWLKAVKFGETEENQLQATSQDEQTAKELGFANAESLDRARRFAALPTDEQERVLAAHEPKPLSAFPEKEPRNPERRAGGVATQAAEAPDRINEERTRTISVNRDKVKPEAEEYLREQYTNPDGDMFCQICQKPLPFKLDDGLFYFEKVEFLSELKQHHYQNYLALCPNHSAMFKLANGSKETLKSSFAAIDGLLLEVVLAQSRTSIRFTKTHIADLKSVIEADQKGAAEA